jgi:hypothetical protein
MVMCEMLDGYLPDMAAVLAKKHRVWRQRCRCWFEQSSKSSCRTTGRREPRSLDQDAAQRMERPLELMSKETKDIYTNWRVLFVQKRSLTNDLAKRGLPHVQGK